MLYGEFTRGTTPTHNFPLPKNLNLTNFIDLTVIYRQKGKNILVKTKENVCESNNHITLSLSQEDTLKFDPRIKFVEVQIKGRVDNNNVSIFGEYRFRLNDCFDENNGQTNIPEVKLDTNNSEQPKIASQTVEQIKNLMYGYASLCNDILKECQHILQEIREEKNND